MINCHKCGAEAGDTAKFCRECGIRIEHPAAEEAATWRLPSGSAGPQATSPVRAAQTGEPMGATGPAYNPPEVHYYEPAPLAPTGRGGWTGRQTVSLREWLSDGWQLYKQNWLVMTLASMFGAFLAVCSVGILAGPLLMGLFGMAFKAMRGERPEMGDLFKWEGKFLKAFLVTLIFAVIHSVIMGVSGKLGPEVAILLEPVITIGLGLTLPMILERGTDPIKAIQDVARLIFKRDAFMWWLAGLVFCAINLGGLSACGIGIFVTVPWIICASAAAYRYTFGIDDPNRTLA